MKLFILVAVIVIISFIGGIAHEVDMIRAYQRDKDFSSSAFWLNWEKEATNADED